MVNGNRKYNSNNNEDNLYLNHEWNGERERKKRTQQHYKPKCKKRQFRWTTTLLLVEPHPFHQSVAHGCHIGHSGTETRCRCVWVSRTDREKWRTSWMEYQYPRCWVTQLYDSLARVGWRQILLLKILKGTRYVHNKFENLCFLCFSVHNTTIVEKYPENVFIHSFLILPKEIGIPYIPFCKEKKLNIVSIAWNQKLNASSS